MTDGTTTLSSKVPARWGGRPLAEYLAERFRYKPREEWEALIRDGKIAVNDGPARADLLVRQRDRVAYEVVLREPPVDRTIRVVHDEATFVVAEKSGQLPSHGDGTFVTHTFVHVLTERLREGGWTGLVRLAHRLDRETSGLMVVAKEKTAHRKLMRQFAAGTVEKEYLAVVRGAVDQERFEIGGFLGRDRESAITIRQRVYDAGDARGREALTRFERVRALDGATLLRCVPKTGRTNQIRVHLASFGHPVIGDKLYGKTDEEFLDFVRHVKAGGDPAYAGHAETPRHLLHASRLSFDHPVTGARVAFDSPPPADMQVYLDAHTG